MAVRDSLQDQQATCDIVGCGGLWAYQVTRTHGSLRVCRRCMQEMVAVFGWTMTATRKTAATRVRTRLTPV